MNSPFLFAVLLYSWIDIGGLLRETYFKSRKNEFFGVFDSKQNKIVHENGPS